MITQEKYLIEVKLWFDRVNGNTYHSLRIINILNSEVITTIGITYGYGEQYKQTAYDRLIKLGLAKEEDRHNHDLNRERFIFIANFGLKRNMFKEWDDKVIKEAL